MILLVSPAGLSAARASPERRVRRYVEAHQDTLQTAAGLHFEQGSLFPAGRSSPPADRYPMVESLFFTTSSIYNGFYDSPDDVPLAFQNTDCLLSATATGRQRQSEGDNRGSTRQIAPCWYSFEVFF